MTFGEFYDLFCCYKIEAGVMKLSVTDDEEMFPFDLR